MQKSNGEVKALGEEKKVGSTEHDGQVWRGMNPQPLEARLSFFPSGAAA